MSKKQKKKTTPKVEIIVEPGLGSGATIPGILASVQALATSQTDTLNSMIRDFAVRIPNPFTQDAIRAREQLALTSDWAKSLASLTAIKMPDFVRLNEHIASSARMTEALVPEARRAFPPAVSQTLLDKLVSKSEALKRENESLRREIESLKLEKEQAATSVSRVSKRGPQRYSDQDKLKALRKWDELDKNLTAIDLGEFLEKEFGADAGVLKVAESTFHGWRQKLRHKGIYRDS